VGRLCFSALIVALLGAASSAEAGRLSSSLTLGLSLRDHGLARAEWEWALPGISREEVGLSLRLHSPMDRAMERRLAEIDVVVIEDGEGNPMHMGPIYAVVAPWDSVDALARMSGIERIESARPPGVAAHLDVSVPEIGAPELWNMPELDDRGGLDGRGVVIGDFDSGIDVFHPLFFFADGGVFDWLDVDGDGAFDPDQDAVDLDRDGELDAGESLGLIEGALHQRVDGWVDGHYDTDLDWLYNDANDSGSREQGQEHGFTDASPSFGEILFLTLDTDLDGRLEVGEQLVALGSSKIVATLVWPDTIRHRGVDLIETPVTDPTWERYYGQDDRADHGTGVSSVLLGGWTGLGRRITGVAPGAELVLVDFNNDLGLAATLPWALSLGIVAGAHPYGHKAFAFLDGSSNDEAASDRAYREHEAPQVVSVGNEARDQSVASFDVPGQGTVEVPFEINHYDWASSQVSLAVITARWRRPELRFDVTVVDPEGNEATLVGGSGSTSLAGAEVEHVVEVSSRGTAKLDIIIATASELVPGQWIARFGSTDDEPTRVELSRYAAALEYALP